MNMPSNMPPGMGGPPQAGFGGAPQLPKGADPAVMALQNMLIEMVGPEAAAQFFGHGGPKGKYDASTHTLLMDVLKKLTSGESPPGPANEGSPDQEVPGQATPAQAAPRQAGHHRQQRPGRAGPAQAAPPQAASPQPGPAQGQASPGPAGPAQASPGHGGSGGQQAGSAGAPNPIAQLFQMMEKMGEGLKGGKFDNALATRILTQLSGTSQFGGAVQGFAQSAMGAMTQFGSEAPAAQPAVGGGGTGGQRFASRPFSPSF